MDWENQTVFVATGTSDSGEAIARTVADAGGTVAFTYNESVDAAEDLLDDLPGEGHESWQCDVTDPEEASAVVDAAFEAFGEIDALVYTIGVISRTSIEDIEDESWQEHLDANVTGAFHLVRAAAPHLEEQGSGAVAVLSASAGILRDPELSAYDASKRALEAFVEETARELGPAGVRANVVAPGFIRDPDALSEDEVQALYDQQPYDRLTTPQDVANACLFLCSDRAATITGATLPVDSGLALS